MRKRSVPVLVVALAGIQLLVTGCAVFLFGAGAAGGYAISKDEIEGHTDARYEKVWTTTREALLREGTLTLDDPKQGLIKAEIKDSEVKAHLEQITGKTVRIRLQARKIKGLFPDIELAQDLYTKIIKELEDKS